VIMCTFMKCHVKTLYLLLPSLLLPC